MRRHAVFLMICFAVSVGAALTFLRTESGNGGIHEPLSSVFLRAPLFPENCRSPLPEPPPTLAVFKNDDLERVVAPIESFLNSHAEACFTANERACHALHDWLRRQLQETMFLPRHKIWKNGEWNTETPDDYDQRLKFDIYGNKMLATMAASYWVLRRKNFPEIPDAKNWFLERYRIFKPHYETDEVYSIPDENEVIEVPMRAGNMSSASARFRAFILLAFGEDAEGMQVLTEQWKTTLLSTRADGSLPVEVRRGARALYYANQTFFDLMRIYLISKEAGHDLTAEYPETKPRLEKAALFLLRAVADFKVVEKYARLNHSPNTDDDYRVMDLQSLKARMSWLPVYMQEFPETEAARLAKHVSVDPTVCSVPKRKKPFDCATGSSKIKDILKKDSGHISGLKPSCFILKKPLAELFSAP
ncbi:MAG TPA: alginate lyase family protein [Pseudobdellovibrionaceae bacterium]|nr:alginate lyase family protein [Pseudobdellovibrionaceae bacterium]